MGRTFVLFRGRRLSYFSGCDYFRLSSHPRVLAAVRRGLDRFGLNVAASRLTTGNHPLYLELEAALARFFAAESATLVSSGYLTNLATAQALAGEFSHVLIDERAHASLFDAATQFQCPVVRFRHRDAADVVRAIRAAGRGARVILLTDGTFAHDGAMAPLLAYRRVLPSSGWLLVDDAHGAGVVGRMGRGTLEAACVDRERTVQTVTLSKAFGAHGGAILGAKEVVERVRTRSAAFFGNTPLPLPLAAAALTALKILAGDTAMRERLRRRVREVKGALASAGLELSDTDCPIIPMPAGSPRAAEKFKERLLRAGIYPPFLRYPGGPAQGSFRFVLSSEHTEPQLENLMRVLLDHLGIGSTGRRRRPRAGAGASSKG
ncbi:MAG TPA: aminotransferase class I/II-fold pyridoxal phosphate-dependent enzyme [Methylomirabilota bacterium]|nr:aminotransferase class I/II-fold pyridoxal phosphate-dependent enzyme [Methylomirabilota bacterium]